MPKGTTHEMVADAVGTSKQTVGAALRGDRSTKLILEIRHIAVNDFGGIEYPIRPIR